LIVFPPKKRTRNLDFFGVLSKEWCLRERARAAIANPLKVKAIAEAKTNTDMVDAEVLAQLLQCDFLPQVWIPDKRTRLLREMCAHRAVESAISVGALSKAFSATLRIQGIWCRKKRSKVSVSSMHVVHIRVGAKILRGLTAGNHQARNGGSCSAAHSSSRK
jgi:hypothetical protein